MNVYYFALCVTQKGMQVCSVKLRWHNIIFMYICQGVLVDVYKYRLECYYLS